MTAPTRPDLDKVKARHVHQWDRCDTCALVAWVEHLESELQMAGRALAKAGRDVLNARRTHEN